MQRISLLTVRLAALEQRSLLRGSVSWRDSLNFYARTQTQSIIIIISESHWNKSILFFPLSLSLSKFFFFLSFFHFTSFIRFLSRRSRRKDISFRKIGVKEVKRRLRSIWFATARPILPAKLRLRRSVFSQFVQPYVERTHWLVRYTAHVVCDHRTYL